MTDAQTRILEAIQRLTDRHGVPPTVRELADELGHASPNGTAYSLARLRDTGRVTWLPGKARTLRVVRPAAA